MEKPEGADDRYNEHEHAKFLTVLTTASATELQVMRKVAMGKMREGNKRPAPCGYNAAQRAAFYTCELIKRGEELRED